MLAGQNQSLVVAGVEIIQDEHGRYNLNVLHRASPAVGIPAKAPSQWLRRKSTKELISEVQCHNVKMHPGEANLHSDVLEVVNGGDRQGVYAHELLAVSYAGWISPAFQLAVNQAFIDLRTGKVGLPAFHNPSTKIAIETLIKIDEMEQRQAEQERRLALANQQMMEIMKAQQWITIRQYVRAHGLERQLPEGKQQQAYGRYLSGYCREKNLPTYRQQSDQFQEWSYPVWAIQETLHGWLAQRYGQMPMNIRIEPDGIRYDEY